MLARYTVIVCLSVCMSVCLSVCHKSEFYTDGKPRIAQTTPYDSPETLVFYFKILEEILTVTPNNGAK